MIYITPYRLSDLCVTGLSEPAGVETFDQAEQVFGQPSRKGTGMLLYFNGEHSAALSKFPISLPAGGQNNVT